LTRALTRENAIYTRVLRRLVIPAKVREALGAHARAEAPNEACGLVELDGERAVRYLAGRNDAASPYRFELAFDDPETWFVAEAAVFHSHLDGPAQPSRADIENVGLWSGKPYLIYSLRDDELAAFAIHDGEVTVIALSAA
jgi:proteasome lid subunit RPN8/RPN11